DASKWPNDDQRPLTDDGIRKFQRAARGIARLVEPPDELLTSTLTRARQTAALLVDAADFPAPSELEPLRPDTPTKTLIAALAKRRPLRVAVVGHEPDLSQLIAALLGATGARVQLKKGACAQLSFTGRVDAGAGQLISLWPPRTLREVARKR
ncbi:MAG TPA: histidine phosphatase family protein, partial [Polyangiales bacterium]